MYMDKSDGFTLTYKVALSNSRAYPIRLTIKHNQLHSEPLCTHSFSFKLLDKTKKKTQTIKKAPVH